MTQKVGGVEFEVEVDSSGVATAKTKIVSDLSQVEESFEKVDKTASKSANNLGKAGNKGAGGIKKLRGAMGNLGFQAQDIAVQLQAGTDAMIVFTQQGSQIAGAFGPTGAIVGGIIAVAGAITSALIPALTAAGNEAVQLPEKLQKRLDEIIKRYNEVGDSTKTAFQSVELDKLNQEYNQLQRRIDQIAQSSFEQAQSIRGTGTAALGAASNINSLRGEQEELLKLINALSDAFLSGVATDTSTIEQNTEQVNESYRKRLNFIQNSLNLEGEAIANANAKYATLAQEGANEQLAILEEQLANERARKDFERERDKTAFEDERASILANEALNAEQKAALVEELRQLELQSKEQHENDLTLIEQKGADARNKIAQKEARDRLNAVSSAFGALSSLMNTESRKMFEIGKIAATANAIIDGIAATQGAYKVGNRIGGPPVGAAFAAAAAAGALANVQQIQSTKFGSAGTGQSFQGGQVVNNVSSQDSAPQQRNISIALTGDNFSGAGIRGLIAAIDEELGDGVSLSTTGR